MKDLLKDFNIKKVSRQLSDECVDLLLINKTNFDTGQLAAIRKSKKTKAAILEEITAIIRESSDCIRILRIAHFFHKNRSAFVGIRNYLSSKDIYVDWEEISKGKSEAEQTVLLYFKHADALVDYFIICIHTHKGKLYCSCRNDYVDDNIPAPKILEELSNKLLNGMKDERGSRYCSNRSFEHDGKIFLILEFDDLPSHQREFEDGKDRAEDKFRRLALDLVYVFDTKNKTVETIAETAELRLLMHRICASVIYGKQEIVARPPKNEVFDLERLLQYALEGKPLSTVDTKSGVKQAYLDSIRIRRAQHPYWEASLNLKMPADYAQMQKDWVKESQSLLKSVINTRDEVGGWWHKSYVQATHADIAIMYWDQIEKKEISKKITVNSSGGTNLDHSKEDENIKIFLREQQFLKTSSNVDNVHKIEEHSHDEEFT